MAPLAALLCVLDVVGGCKPLRDCQAVGACRGMSAGFVRFYTDGVDGPRPKHTKTHKHPGESASPPHQPSTRSLRLSPAHSMNTQSAVLQSTHAASSAEEAQRAGCACVGRICTGVRGHCERRRRPCATAMRADPPSPLALVDALDGVVSDAAGLLGARKASSRRPPPSWCAPLPGLVPAGRRGHANTAAARRRITSACRGVIEPTQLGTAAPTPRVEGRRRDGAQRERKVDPRNNCQRAGSQCIRD